ncbi:hypothetical protein EMIHUDRAFT_205393 [Emiliania huxleyi CCMP1516]|uniref:Uncharacterized protein n=2 Tax=Emiliania huxleyi TaxID=2903 RepID=A0A0D3JS98_EMIH1|nr:hypothetical protein EMIHUDRAFT_205393 [Emiliania huxleyi CCMP1516]EOD26383.1 hypothetical protein EMIHUDRAFT_205393 [Emiliania huxleyi CCMP1516]|eukprot:XP_005778812.1 hypothetical protein EMIHUDRAFT_205393 [Emiliania huxleyi CCMP1516]
MTPVVETVAPVEPVKPVEETPTEADSTVAAVEADVWKVDLCGGCCKSAGCAGCCCPCCVVGANAKMIQTGKVVQVCDGGGGLCCLHAAVGGTIQGVAIFVLGPLAGLVHFGSLIACGVRTDLRKKYNIQGDSFSDCCIHYWIT